MWDFNGNGIFYWLPFAFPCSSRSNYHNDPQKYWFLFNMRRARGDEYEQYTMFLWDNSKFWVFASKGRYDRDRQQKFTYQVVIVSKNVCVCMYVCVCKKCLVLKFFRQKKSKKKRNKKWFLIKNANLCLVNWNTITKNSIFFSIFSWY